MLAAIHDHYWKVELAQCHKHTEFVQLKRLQHEAWYLASLHIKSLTHTPITLSAMSIKLVQCFICNWAHFLTVFSARSSCTLCIVSLVLVFGLYLVTVLLKKNTTVWYKWGLPLTSISWTSLKRVIFVVLSRIFGLKVPSVCELRSTWTMVLHMCNGTSHVGKSFFTRRKSEYNFVVPKNCSTIQSCPRFCVTTCH